MNTKIATKHRTITNLISIAIICALVGCYQQPTDTQSQSSLPHSEPSSVADDVDELEDEELGGTNPVEWIPDEYPDVVTEMPQNIFPVDDFGGDMCLVKYHNGSFVKHTMTELMGKEFAHRGGFYDYSEDGMFIFWEYDDGTLDREPLVLGIDMKETPPHIYDISGCPRQIYQLENGFFARQDKDWRIWITDSDLSSKQIELDFDYGEMQQFTLHNKNFQIPLNAPVAFSYLADLEQYVVIYAHYPPFYDTYFELEQYKVGVALFNDDGNMAEQFYLSDTYYKPVTPRQFHPIQRTDSDAHKIIVSGFCPINEVFAEEDWTTLNQDNIVIDLATKTYEYTEMVPLNNDNPMANVECPFELEYRIDGTYFLPKNDSTGEPLLFVEGDFVVASTYVEENGDWDMILVSDESINAYRYYGTHPGRDDWHRD